MDDGWVLPFEKNPDGPIPFDAASAILAGGIAILSLAYDSPITGKREPALCFQFEIPGERLQHRVVLFLDRDRLKLVPMFVKQAVDTGIEMCG